MAGWAGIDHEAIMSGLDILILNHLGGVGCRGTDGEVERVVIALLSAISLLVLDHAGLATGSKSLQVIFGQAKSSMCAFVVGKPRSEANCLWPKSSSQKLLAGFGCGCVVGFKRLGCYVLRA